MAYVTLMSGVLDRSAVYQSAVILVILTTVAVAYVRSCDRALDRFPTFGYDKGGIQKRREYFFQHARELFLEGCKKFRTTVWRLTSADGEILVMPLQYAEELRKQPDNIINSVVAMAELVEAKNNGLTPDNPLMVHVIKSDLTHNLPKVTETLWNQVVRTVPAILGGSEEEWSPMVVYGQMLRVVAILSGSIFIGPDLCRRPEYLHASINYTVDVFKSALALKRWFRALRPIVKYWVPQVRTIREHRKKAHEFLVPVIRERRALAERGEKDAPSDMIQWLVNKAPKFGVTSDEKLAEVQLTLSMAAIHTTCGTVTQILYDLAGQCPEIIPELRKEVQSVLEANNGTMTIQAVFQLKLLDSVMRESQRTNPSQMVRMTRRVMKTFQFSDGTEIPAGSTIAVPILPVLQGSEYYTDPHSFDPYRFVHLRNGEVDDPLQYQNKEQYQYVSVTKENMGFGYGRHACPGRFFATTQMKLTLAYILLNYELKMPDGVKGRYANVVKGSTISPDPTKSIFIRKLRKES